MKDLQGTTDQLGAGFEQELDELDRLLTAYRIPIREGFTELVMETLPEVSWGRRRVGVWVAAIVLALAFAGTGAWLLGSGTASALGSIGALADLFVTGLLAGAGLLSASWSGLSTTVKAAASGSPSSIVVLGIAAAAVGLLLLLLLRRRRGVQPVAAQPASLAKRDRR